MRQEHPKEGPDSSGREKDTTPSGAGRHAGGEGEKTVRPYLVLVYHWWGMGRGQ